MICDRLEADFLRQPLLRIVVDIAKTECFIEQKLTCKPHNLKELNLKGDA